MEEQLNKLQSEAPQQVRGKQPKKKKIITAVIFFIIILAIVYLGATEGARWWQEKQKWVKMGFAHDKFPFKMLTEEELVRKGLWSGESEWYNSIPTRTTPEETYAIFKQALIDGDFDKAAECFTEEKRQEYREAMNQAKNEGRIPEIIKQLTEIYPEEKPIVKGLNDDNMTTYYMVIVENGQRTNNPIPFMKDLNGDWKMEAF
jgi:hypothetical protein